MDTREAEDGTAFRRHSCPNCGHKIRTVEVEIDTVRYAPLHKLDPHVDALKARMLAAVTEAINGYQVGERIKLYGKKD